MEITNKVRIKALKWFKDLGFEKRTELSLKNFDTLTPSADEVVIIWRRKTGGEWA